MMIIVRWYLSINSFSSHIFTFIRFITHSIISSPLPLTLPSPSINSYPSQAPSHP